MNVKVHKEFARLVRRNRRLRNLSQTELGEIIGMTRATVSHIELGLQKIFLGQAVKLSTYLSISLDALKDIE